MSLTQLDLELIPLPALQLNSKLEIVGSNLLFVHTFDQDSSQVRPLVDFLDLQSYEQLIAGIQESPSESSAPLNLCLTSSDISHSVEVSWKRIGDMTNSAYLLVLNCVDKYVDEIEKLRFYATRDSLTGSLNRWAFFSRFDEEFKKADRYDLPLSVVIFDVDLFKRINDTYGHPVGDALLIHIVKTARDSLRNSDILARIGGDEFAILMPHTGYVQAGEVAERLLHNINHSVMAYDEHRITPKISLGVASTKGAQHTVQTLMAQCDRALYQAKRKSHGRIDAISDVA
ncbi:MAG: GGDEF domain-containing protein [Gammaproteobacteria bacterium]|nr:GGDEF domain-containing protein [Gammaproteobacteria bacterium]